MTKQDIFSLINMNDYNNALEVILETKDFSEDVKNLLLSMLYKIENAYEDYETIKINVQTKKQYIRELLNIINNCNEIILAKPNSKENEMLKKENVFCLVDESKEKIISYQNEEMMLQAISKIKPKQIIIKPQYELYEKALKELFNKGFVSNNVEVIRDFNGWSWDINEKQIEDIVYNLIYQNMLIIFGNKFINCILENCMEENVEEHEIPNNEIIRSKYFQIAGDEEDKQIDYIQEMENILKEKYGEELEERLKEDFKKVILIMISNRNEEERRKIKKIKRENETLLGKMKNKEEYLEEITSRKKELTIQIKNIDNIINDNKLLKEEYEKINKTLSNKEKIFSPSQFANRLITKRKEILKEIDNINKIMIPKEFVKLKEEKEKKKEFFSIWNVEESNKIDEKIFVEQLQNSFLECLKIEIQKSDDKKQIIQLIYNLRYYELLPFDNKKIYENEKLQENIKIVEQELIKKACNEKILTRLSQDDNVNYKILKNIFVSKIVNLDNIIIVLNYNKGILTVGFYDGNIIENTVEIKIEEKTELAVRLNKKIKIFGK